ncbi:MAG: NADH pyrophosphatase [Sphingobium sp. 32-64-5]|nr:MAG: NADH pyrophosphatase [Sphingobium sp. 32-64-5]
MHDKYSQAPGFSIPSIDRWDLARADPDLLAGAFADKRARRLILDGLDPVLDGPMLAREVLPPQADLAGHLLLGRETDGAPLFVELRRDVPHGAAYAPRVWEAAAELEAAELSLYGGARSLIDWHARHGFCAVCGGRTVVAKGGWARRCEGCEAEHFPRVDPVVIMLAEYRGRVLVARQPRFPEKRYSALAGFVEPGETIEGAVARELFEEAGLHVRDIRYVMSQPWPFPSSLMIACMAQADDDRLTIDYTELEDAFWVDAAGVRAALNGDADAPFIAPPAMAVARYLFLHWLEELG